MKKILSVILSVFVAFLSLTPLSHADFQCKDGSSNKGIFNTVTAGTGIAASQNSSGECEMSISGEAIAPQYVSVAPQEQTVGGSQPPICGVNGCPVAVQYQVVAPYIIALQYMRLPYVNGPSAAYRPSSSYSPRGSVIVMGDARSTSDCGAVGLGTAFVVCAFNGQDWKVL